MIMKHLLIIPIQKCTSGCRYCFTPGTDSRIMPITVLSQILDLFKILSKKTHKHVQITFHGGEPLLAGFVFFQQALKMIRKRFGGAVVIGIQSNLWLIDDKLINLFKKYNVSIGTSLDGPEEMNDIQRGSGYYKKCHWGVKRLLKNGIVPGCIATFTSLSASKADQVFDYFLEMGLPLNIHPAVKPLSCDQPSIFFLQPGDFGALIVKFLSRYLDNLSAIKISTLDDMVRNIACNHSGLCTFSSCLGNYIAATPDGMLYPCNRFSGWKEFAYGHCSNIRSMEDIQLSEGWLRLEHWKKYIDKKCNTCSHFSICKGGCPFTAISYGNGRVGRDPFCRDYKYIYDHIIEQGVTDFFSKDNLGVILEDTAHSGRQSLLRKDGLLSLMNGDPHPFDIKHSAINIVTAVLIASGMSPEEIIETLSLARVTRFRKSTFEYVKRLQNQLEAPGISLGTIYLNLVSGCNLSCSYCHQKADSLDSAYHMPIEKIMELISSASSMELGKIILTGGEPTTHPEFGTIALAISTMRKKQIIPEIHLRTNMIDILPWKMKTMPKDAFDKIIVSLDGTAHNHDRYRGEGTYDTVVSNLKYLIEKLNYKNISLAAVYDHSHISMSDRDDFFKQMHVIQKDMNIKTVRYMPLIPVGKADGRKTDPLPEKRIDLKEWTGRRRSFRMTCGLGRVLMITAEGCVYPCHVLKKDDHYLGSVFEDVLPNIVKKRSFKKLAMINVNSDSVCSKCIYRYICGGICKAWNKRHCNDKFKNSELLFKEAMSFLNFPSKII